MSVPDPAAVDWVPIWNLGAGFVTYGTAFPTSPADGAEHVLVDSLTAPTFSWRFRYNAGRTSDANKWEFVGGPLLQGWWSQSSYGAPGNGYVPIPAAGTRIVVPRPGTYAIGFWLTGQDGGGANVTDIYGIISDADGNSRTFPYDAWTRITGQYQKATIGTQQQVGVGSTVNARTLDVRGVMTNGPAGGFVWYSAKIWALPVAVS